MRQIFYKYQGTGNDFILIDNRSKTFPDNNRVLVSKLCNRRFGIGADGLILLEESSNSDFKMVYFNSDGSESTLCGNGARCTVAFAAQLGIITSKTKFEAIDGLHLASIKDEIVSLEMHDVQEIQTFDSHSFLDTGSPHHVEIVQNLKSVDVFTKGREIRTGAPYYEAGSNVNFVEQIDPDQFAIRTYERGVEDETLSCGTGATAVAIAMHKNKKTSSNKIKIKVVGGVLEVSFDVSKSGYSNIILSGPAELVYSGTLNL